MNTNTTHRTTVGTRSRQLLSEVRDELRERREARAERRTLQRELSLYNTQAQVDDLLAILENQDHAEANQIREILVTQSLRDAS